MAGESAPSDAFPPDVRVIEVHVAELRQLFNSMDPSPFTGRDLDPDAEEFIVATARELPRESALGLLVRLAGTSVPPNEAVVLQRAVASFFDGRAAAARQRLRALFHRGRVSLVIGLAFLGTALAVSELLGQWAAESGFVSIVQESLLIGGWVAMWRPIEIFLYDWWPIRADARLFDRLTAMPVRIAGV